MEDLSGHYLNTLRGPRELLESMFVADVKVWNLLLGYADQARKRSANPEDAKYLRPSRQSQKQTRLTVNEIDRLVERYKSGTSTYQLAKEFKCHRTTVSGHLKTRGVKIRG